ncbi:Uncharacterised protein [Cedecea lapagei]|uniref:Phage-related minor tail protein n=1 Tax=Cedecea lapagei TaxID=158823 RepID=A0A3S4MHL2_9ENTR|nr:hypothetical protein [Cedecea lapagei]VEC02022.1 Uncharacterised protein [Cedecea lapagei]
MEKSLGGIYIEVDIETDKMIESSRKAKAEMDALSKSVERSAPGFDRLSKSAKGVSSALAMPEVNRLSNQLAQLSGKIGAASESTIDASVAQDKFSGALSTAASQLGAGYVTNIGSATSSLIKHAKEAVNATKAQAENALAAKKEAEALRVKAEQLVVAASAEKAQAEATVLSTESEVKAAEAIFERKQADIGSLEALLARQKESLKQSEANLQITNSEKAVSEAARARSTVEATKAKIIKQSNEAVKEIYDAENKAAKAKEASAAAALKLAQATALESTAKETSAAATNAAAVATERLTLAARAQTLAIVGARSALALLGGTGGVLLLAAAGVYQLYQAMSYTKEIDDFNKKIDDSIDRIDTLNNAQARYAADKFGNDIDTVKVKMERYRAEIESLQKSIRTAPVLRINTDGMVQKLNQMQALYGEAERRVLSLSEASDRASIRASKTTTVTDRQVDAQNALNDATKSLTHQNTLLANSLTEGEQAAKDTAQLEEFEKRLNSLGIYGEVAADAVAKFASELQQNRDLTLSKAVDDAKNKVEELTIRLKEGEQAAIRFNAARNIKDSGWDENSQEAKDYIAYQEKIFALNKQISDKRKQDNADKAGARKDASNAESVAQKLANLKQQSELAADSARELSREQATLKAQQSLGKAATQDQIKQAGEYAAKTWDVNNALKAQAAAEKLIPERQESTRYSQETKDLKTALDAKKITQDEFNQATERAEQQHQSNLAKIRSDAVVSPQQEAAGMVDPVQQLANENARKLALIQQFETEKGRITANGLALMNAANKQYEQQRIDAQWEIFRNQSQSNELLAASLDGLQSGASSAITGLLNGTQSLSESFANIGNTILNSVVSSLVQMGMEYVKSAVIGQAANATAASSAAATGASIAASMAPAAAATNIATMGQASTIGLAAMSASIPAMLGMLSGRRKNGGPVNAGGLYEFGEGNLPEVLQVGGKSYMLPGNNGRVFSNKDATGAPAIPKASSGSQYNKSAGSDAGVNSGGDAGKGSVIQHITFEINTTGGVTEADFARIEARGVQISKKMALFHIHDEATRPGGIIQRRVNK